MYGGPVSMSGPDPAAERPRNPRHTPKAQPDREGDLPTPDCCRKAALPAPTCKVQNEGAAPHTGGGAFFHVRRSRLRVWAPPANRHHAAARTKGPDRPTSGPAPQPTSRARRSFPSRTLHPKAGGTRGIREATPPKKRQAEAKRHPGMDLSHAIPSKADRKPEAPAKAANRGEGGTEGKEGKEEGKEKRGGGSQKAGKQESRKAGKQEAGKRGSREAGGGIKKRRRTVGCTSACGSQQSLAYRNYLLR